MSYRKHGFGMKKQVSAQPKPVLFYITVFASISHHVSEAVVVVYPVPLNVDDRIFVTGVPDDHLGNTGVYYHTLAHGTAGRIGHQLAGFAVPSGQIQGGADHIPAGSADNGVGLAVNAAAQLVALPSRYLELLPAAEAQIGAVPAASGSACVARGDYFVVVHDY